MSRLFRSHCDRKAMKTVKTILIFAVTVLTLREMALAQFRPPATPQQQMHLVPPQAMHPLTQSNRTSLYLQRPQPIPVDAYRRMDTHSQIDPRILQAQQEAKAAEEKARKIENRKWEYRRALRQQVNQSTQLRGFEGEALVAREQAQEDAAQYFTLREFEGSANAQQWLAYRKAEILKGVEAAQRAQGPIALYNTAKLIAAAGAQAAGPEIVASSSRPLAQEEVDRLEVQNVGQAAKLQNQVRAQKETGILHYDLLVKFTESVDAPRIEPALKQSTP